MNTLSSLLYFIGTTIGANPNSLTTSSKTFVGAINEVNSRIHYLNLDTTATSGTDKEIYDALVSLGWDSDVIV
jgi:hypothetical protein